MSWPAAPFLMSLPVTTALDSGLVCLCSPAHCLYVRMYCAYCNASPDVHQSCGELLAIDEDYDVEDDRDHKHPRVTPREKDSAEHPAGTMQVQLSTISCFRLHRSALVAGAFTCTCQSCDGCFAFKRLLLWGFLHCLLLSAAPYHPLLFNHPLPPVILMLDHILSLLSLRACYQGHPKIAPSPHDSSPVLQVLVSLSTPVEM